jgi:uncharacterized membrane protein YesL
MIAGGKVVGWALFGLYDETFLLLKANLAWFLLSAPLALPVLLLLSGLLPANGPEEYAPGMATAAMLSGFLLLIVPTPASLGLCGLAAVMTRKESPPLSLFWQTTRQNFVLGLALYLIGLLGIVILGVNTAFYFQVEPPLLRFLGVLWIYLGLFWLAMQLYVGPLAIVLGERRPLALYKRAALLVLAHPIYTLVLLLAASLVMLLSLIMVPLYLSLAMAFVALMSTRALAELKRKYDPAPEQDEESA